MDPELPHSEDTPAFNSLRSKFEKLALEAKATTVTIPKHDPHEFLSSGPHSPRQRTVSNGDGIDFRPPTAPHLRSATSSSDLKAAKKPPPPPPPSRGSKAPSSPPDISPLLRPVPAPPISISTFESNITLSLAQQPSSLQRKPPPVPSMRNGTDQPSDPVPSIGGVASLKSKFSAPSSTSLPQLPSTRSKPSNSRIVSQPVIVSSPDPLETSAVSMTHASRHSLSTTPSRPLIQTQSPSPVINLQSSLLNNDPEYDHSTPPPLPSRNKREQHSPSKRVVQHTRDPSCESSETNSSPISTSADSDVSGSMSRSHFLPSPPKRPTIQPPPRPPPRHGSLMTPSSSESMPFSSEPSSVSATPTLQLPPPLPVRRSSPMLIEDRSSPPNLPARALSTHESDPHFGSSSAPPAPDRRVVGSSHLPPPPTRTIALGDKLPPPRKAPSGGSSEDSGDDEDSGQKGRAPDLLPDASHSSRRPPVMTSHHFARFKAHIPAHTGQVAVSGNHAVVAHGHVKIYDLAISETPLYHIDLKEVALEWRVKDPRVTSMGFRHVSNEADRGCFLWLGTKDGHLWELDVRTGTVIYTKAAAHSHAVTSIFRHGRTMITLDENGKALVFSPEHDSSAEDVCLAYTQPRIVRIADKQGFARMLGGLLWTSGGPGTGSTGAPQSNGAPGLTRGPIIRVYDILSSTCSAKSLLPSEAVGAVTSGTILPSQPHNVYLGHEGGFISIWNLQKDDGVPSCTEVIKVSASDVLCLEGVNDRLWAGGRNGMISAYDVEQKPWWVTNNWMAHAGLPVQKLTVDPWSIEKCGQLCVVSIGRDEQAKIWDGLLGIDWIDAELLKREALYSTFRTINVLIVSWNIDAAKPDALTGNADNVNFLESALRSVDSPDIISFGFQEVIDLESRKMAAKTVLLGGKKKAADGSISEKVSRSYKRWYDRLILAVRLAMPPDCPYTVVHTDNLVGLFSCIFVKNSERTALKDIAITTIKRGMGGRYGNKGGIIARFVMDDSSICLINCHLAAGQNHSRTRNGDVAAILEEKAVFPETDAFVEPIAYTGGGDGSMILDHEIVFLNGDMNYRIDQRREPVIAAIRAGDLSHLLVHDQLLKEMKFNRGFRLRSFVEGPITFVPTYKYDRKSSEYDSSEKRRVPAWCDRILYRSVQPDRVKLLHYRRYEPNISDHRPISAGFHATVKSVRHDARAKVKEEVEELWFRQQQQLLIAARDFYVSHEII